MLRRIWCSLLNISKDGIYLAGGLFTRGGDSITAIKLVSKARQQGMQLIKSNGRCSQALLCTNH